MIKKFGCKSLLVLCQLVCFLPDVYADFDERYWEKYTEIHFLSEGQLPPLGGIYIEPGYFENLKTSIPFSDMRIITEDKMEVPYQIITRSQETKLEDLKVRMLNLSYTKQKEIYLAGLIGDTSAIYNMVDILTNEVNFYCQAQLFGSMDGKDLKLIRNDGVIFDYSREEKLRHTKITFSDSNYRNIGIKLICNTEKPFKVSGLKVFYQKMDPGIETAIGAWISKKEEDRKMKESNIIISVSSLFPVRKIDIASSDKNFQRKVDIWARQNGKDWTKWADDMIFNFDTERIKESKLYITFPEVSAKEIKLVVKNYDSPPINIAGITVTGYKKLVIFKIAERQKHYVFWGNKQAKMPQYDISPLIAKHNIKDIMLFPIDIQRTNPKFIGYEKMLPFTERYKHLLYVVVILGMALLIFLQYKVIKKTDKT